MTGDPFEAPRAPDFPPLFRAEPLGGSADPLAKACAMAALGCDSGLLAYNIGADRLRAAIVFAPEMPLSRAMQVFCACATGFQNAFGALAPPEVAMHLTWGGNLLVNGAVAGRLRAVSPESDPENNPGKVPDWLVVGLDLWLLPRDGDEPGHAPDETCLFLEGCAAVSPVELLEGWARHTLVWVNGLVEGDIRPLHAAWRELLYGIGKDISETVGGQTLSGRFLGADEDFAMLLREGGETRAIPLVTLLKKEDSP